MIRRAFAGLAASFAIVMFVGACAGNGKRTKELPPLPPPIPEPTGPNTITAAEKRAGWALLFDGRTLVGWHAYKQARGVTTGWMVDDGAITPLTGGGDLVTDQQFGSFELTLEWKISPKGSSGIFFWGNEGTDHMYENAPEMRILDNLGVPEGQSALNAAGSLYGLYPVIQNTAKPVGQWNEVRIIVHGSKVQQWLNGVRVVEADFDTKEMKDRIHNSRFKDWLSFGKSRRGHIGLQNAGAVVWFRNIKIKDSE